MATRRRRKTKSPARVLGIDPSLTSTGISINGATAEFKNELRGYERISYIVQEILSAITTYHPTHVCIEGYAMGRVGGMMFDRAELVGGLKLLCLSLGLPTIVVPPTTLKKYVTGNGSAKKPLMMATIKRKWGRSFVSSDRADAFALEQFGLEFLGEQVVVRGEQACLKKATIEHPTDRMKSLSDAYDRALTRIA